MESEMEVTALGCFLLQFTKQLNQEAMAELPSICNKPEFKTNWRRGTLNINLINFVTGHELSHTPQN